MTANKILIVNDESSIRNLVRSYLEADEFDVLEAENGADAVKLVREHSPDLVVLDVGMPVLDGIEALREIRTFSDTYIVMLTARPAPITAQHSRWSCPSVNRPSRTLPDDPGPSAPP